MMQPIQKHGKSTSIPLKSGSDKDDSKQDVSAIVSKGNLKLDGVNINNNYNSGIGNGIVNVVSGNLTLINSKFNHNRTAAKGGVVYIGSDCRQAQTTYLVKNIVIDKCDFSSNYSKNGGAIYVYNTEKVDLTNSNFVTNTVTGGKGGAILINNQSTHIAEKLGLKFTQFKVDNCIFDGNWVGNDGAAIENHEAELTMTNSIFKNNVGIHCSSSCGTVSFYYGGSVELKQVFKNCVFETNIGSASTIADHGSFIKIDVIDTKFIKNKATYNSILLYTAEVKFDNCQFEGEEVARTVVDVQAFHDENSGMKPATTIFNNVTFNDTKNGVTDILVRRKNGDLSLNQSTVLIEGNSKAKVDVWHKNKLIVNGNLTGDINKDAMTPNENIVINENAKVNGNIYYNPDKHTVSLIYPNIETTWEKRRYIYSETKTFTNQEFFMEHFISEDGYELEYYTDAAYKNKWNYEVASTMEIYGKWVEHEHMYDGDMVVYDNKIYEQCKCGYLGRSVSFKVPTDFVENGKEISIGVNNELGILSDEYTLVYQEKEEDGTWKNITGTPVKKGSYKAILTYKNMSIEQEYAIEEKAPVNKVPESEEKVNDNNTSDMISSANKKQESLVEKVENPKTSDDIMIFVVMLVISFIGVVLTNSYYKNNK